MKLKIEDLLSLEDYDAQREVIKKDLINHKKNRTVSIGEHIILLFEDYSTIKYQVQEMLRIEKIFNKKEMQEEIDAYNPLIPDGDNLKATMLIGPEGGLSEKEISVAEDSGYKSVLLGKRILRTETASLAAIANMQLLWGN